MGNYKYKRMGYAFEKEVGEGLSKLPGYHFKIPDSRTMQFKTQPVPSDFIWFGKYQIVFLEAKSTLARSFPLSNIKPHQLTDGLVIEQETLAEYFFIIQMKYWNKVFLINPTKVHYLMKKNKKSLSHDDLVEWGIEVPRLTARFNNGKCAFVDLQVLEK